MPRPPILPWRGRVRGIRAGGSHTGPFSLILNWLKEGNGGKKRRVVRNAGGSITVIPGPATVIPA